MSRKTVWLVASAAAAAVLAGVVPARAEPKVVVKIPFDFMVGDTRLPAGNYVITEVSSAPGVVSVASDDGEQMVQVLTQVGSASEADDMSPALTFQKVDGTYFLSRVMTRPEVERDVPLPAAMQREIASNERGLAKTK